MSTRRGQTYLIRADNNLYKIGVSKVIEKRFKNLQADNACTLELLWVYEAERGFVLEAALHRLFWSRRHHGEWFALSESNVRFVLELDNKTIKALLEAHEAEKRREQWEVSETRRRAFGPAFIKWSEER